MHRFRFGWILRKALALPSIAAVSCLAVSDAASARPVLNVDQCGSHAPIMPSGDATIRVDGRSRTYRVHVSPGLAHAAAAIIFVFHGRGETPEQIAGYSGMSNLRAIVVYPRGEPGRGGKLGWSGTPTAAPGVDDVRFVEATLHRIEQTACIDAGRIFATGKSDGGGLAAQLACDDASEFRAIAPVAGAYYPIAGGCHPQRPVAILEFHGTGDRVIPYAGSERRKLPAIPQWLGEWATRDGCSSSHSSRGIASGVTLMRWTRCACGQSVAAYRIEDGGHTWPGAVAPSGPGKTVDTPSATALIGRFFRL